MKSTWIILFACLFMTVYSTIPADVESKGKEAMIDPSRPYSDFETYQFYYEKEYRQKIVHPMMETILRPSQPKVNNRSLIDLIVKRGQYIEPLVSFGQCYPSEIDKGECCPNIFPQTKLDSTSRGGWILVDYGESTTKDTQGVFTNKKNHYAILRNDIFKKVVITYPGTKDPFIQTMSEIINNKLVDFSFKRYTGGIQMTKYFGFRAECIMENVFSRQNIKEMKIAQGYQIIFAGHSLGGAMAAATLLFALDRKHIVRELNHPVLVTYGQPRTGNDVFVKTLEKEAEVVYRFANSEDPVTQIPLYDWGHRHTNGRIYIEGDKTNYVVPSSIFNYELDTIYDEQELNAFEIIGKLTSAIHRHTFYFTREIGTYCRK